MTAERSVPKCRRSLTLVGCRRSSRSGPREAPLTGPEKEPSVTTTIASLQVENRGAVGHVPHRDRGLRGDRDELLAVGAEADRPHAAPAHLDELRLPAGLD